MTYLLILFAALSIADAWTTWHILRFGGFERNTWIAKLISTLGLYWTLMLVKVGAVVAVWALAYFYPFDWRIMAAIDAGYALQVFWNYQQLQKHKSP